MVHVPYANTEETSYELFCFTLGRLSLDTGSDSPLFFQVINNNGSAEFLISTNRTFSVSPEFIGSRLLLKMRKMAERQLGVLIQKAVISVPAEFDERQRNSTVRAAELAGQLFLPLLFPSGSDHSDRVSPNLKS